jgi:hypothetical protein
MGGASSMGGGPGLTPNFGMDSADDMGGARAIEVAAMLEGSIVGVKHVMEPKGGKITVLTKGLFAGGLVLLLVSGIAFSMGLSNAEFNKHSTTMGRGESSCARLASTSDQSRVRLDGARWPGGRNLLHVVGHGPAAQREPYDAVLPYRNRFGGRVPHE